MAKGRKRAAEYRRKTTTVRGERRVRESPVAPTVLDLFAGAGGISEGFRQAGYEVIGGSEIDPDAAATFALNFDSAETVCGDLRQPEVRASVHALAERADVIVGGPPCQAFSQVRNHTRMIDDPRNSLYREFVGAVRCG